MARRQKRFRAALGRVGRSLQGEEEGRMPRDGGRVEAAQDYSR